MRIRTTGDHEWRTDLYDEVAENFGEDARNDGINAACEFSNQMLQNRERAVNHPDMTEDLAELLSTTNVTIEHRVVTDVEIKG
jgi:hypothetical protein